MTKGKYARKGQSPFGPLILILLVVLLVALGLLAFLLFRGCAPLSYDQPTGSTHDFGLSTQGTTQAPTTIPTEPPTTAPYIAATASIGVTGDVMGHGPFIRSCLDADGNYDFTEVYSYIKPYFERYDFMIANLEVTLGGTAAGAYKGYPKFNSPDASAIALKEAGVDMVLTANNHSYDTGHNGFMRTQQVLRDIGLPYLGTRTETTTPEYVVQDINGIKIGMVCYTYEYNEAGAAAKALNGITMTKADSPLISSFNYGDLDGFYDDVMEKMEDMQEEGAEVIMVFLHWGDEYQTKPNSKQKTIAQSLCDLGVDVIVGGHPHVVQPMELLNGENGNTTYCLYSMGNCISNQRREEMPNTSPNGYSEDGLIFSITYQKWNDGTVEPCDIQILPTWVSMDKPGGKREFRIIPLDTAVAGWSEYPISKTSETYKSYARTMSILGEGLNACRESLALAPVPLTHEE